MTPSRLLPRPLRSVLAVARRRRRSIAYTGYALASAVSLLIAFALRFDLQVPDNYRAALPTLVLTLVALRLVMAPAFRLLSARWRYVGVDDLVRLFLASTLSTLVFLAIFRGFFTDPGVPLSVVGMEWAFFNFGVGGTWLLYRWTFERLRGRYVRSAEEEKRVLIVGAGEAGHYLMTELTARPGSYRVLGFLDDDPVKRGTRILGAEVLGTVEEAVALAGTYLADEVVLAVPSASPADLRRMLAQLEPLRVPVRVLPGIRAVLEGDQRMSHLRPLRIDDLLGRPPISLEIPELEDALGGKTVLITGAAGSIGSELARQVAANGPARLVLLDQAESELYFVDLELRQEHPDLEIVPVVADVLDEVRLTDVFDRYRPDRAYHAAAYKHVPLMEANRGEAVRNNVLGTFRVARMAGERGLESFVLVSTDKAADPVSVMGATKRAAEIVLQELHERHPDTHYVAVRFGNVLGSSGSVIPLFQKQIARGGPITITHPDVTRYFMTIPEAVRLVLQAGLLAGARGRIAMLEMGEPVRIVELARNLVRLSGLRPEVDIEFRYVGLRPGEKLHEALNGAAEVLEPTRLESVGILRTEPAQGQARVLPSLEQFAVQGPAAREECQAWLEAFVLGLVRDQEADAGEAPSTGAPSTGGAGSGEAPEGADARAPRVGVGES